jgi:sodium/potassium-transporting ATPase subunit alpha
VLRTAGWEDGQPIRSTDALFLTYRKAKTACRGAIVAMQIANLSLCRHDRKCVCPFQLFNNRWLWPNVAIEGLLAAAIAYASLEHAIFQTCPLTFHTGLFIAPFPFAVAWLEETRELWMRRKLGGQPTAASNEGIRPPRLGFRLETRF